jgi:hypothetical protein
MGVGGPVLFWKLRWAYDVHVQEAHPLTPRAAIERMIAEQEAYEQMTSGLEHVSYMHHYCAGQLRKLLEELDDADRPPWESPAREGLEL